MNCNVILEHTIKYYMQGSLYTERIDQTSKPISDQKLRKSLAQGKDFPGTYPEEGYMAYHAEENNLGSYTIINNHNHNY